MKTLDDYEGLKRGDWIGFDSGEWFEILSIGTFGNPVLSNINYLKSDIVKAVLRPSVIIRDILDNALRDLKNDNHISSYSQPYLVFNIIHPKQEAKEGLSIDVLNALGDLYTLRRQGVEMKEKIDELEKILASK